MIRTAMDHSNYLQSAWAHTGAELVAINLPGPEVELLPGVVWGRAEDLLTAAFWKYQVQMQREAERYTQFKLGRSLLEEVAVCLLGGYGMPAELGLAAFERLKSCCLLDGRASPEAIEDALSEPFLVTGKARKYRFIRQKSRYLSAALSSLASRDVPKEAVALRDHLTSMNGIGPKTASWIVRNHLGSDDIAILDVHIIRAGKHMGIYDGSADPNRHYYLMESKFLEFCTAIEEPASLVDAIMWDYMRRLGRVARISEEVVH